MSEFAFTYPNVGSIEHACHHTHTHTHTHTLTHTHTHTRRGVSSPALRAILDRNKKIHREREAAEKQAEKERKLIKRTKVCCTHPLNRRLARVMFAMVAIYDHVVIHIYSPRAQTNLAAQ
jgi:hypothetical protein